MAESSEAVRRFLQWWWDELVDLVPAPVQGWWQSSGRRYVLAPQGDHLAWSEEFGSKTIRQGMVDSGRDWRRGEGLPKSVLAGPTGLRLPRSACLCRRIKLPFSARRDFRRILQIDLESSTPFRNSEVYSDYFIEGQPAEDGKVDVCQVIVKRKTIDELLQEGQNFQVAFVDAWNDDGSPMPVNLLRGTPGGDTLGTPKKLSPVLALGIASLVLAASAVALAFHRYDAASEQIGAEIANMRAQALTIRRSWSEAEATLKRIADFRRIRADAPKLVAILDELTRLLPDTVWVSHLELEGNMLNVTVVAPSASDVLPMLQRATFAKGATLASPVTFDVAGTRERATVRITLAPAAGKPDAGGGT